jgi:hypothetical protein
MTTALCEFEEAAKNHASATARGDYQSANHNHDLLAAVASRLLEAGELERLKPLLDHSDPGVRLWAATYLLQSEESSAISVLQSIARTRGIIGFDAEMVLREWLSGNLRLPGSAIKNGKSCGPSSGR